jgi:hypothetical protein
MKKEKRSIRGKPYKELAAKLNRFCETIPHDRYETYKILSSGKSFRLVEILARPRMLFGLIESMKKGFPISLRLKIVGASIVIKNSVRVFYPDQLLSAKNRKLEYSAKVGLKSAFRDGNLANEIAAKEFVEKYAPKLPVPKTVGYDPINRFWFIERYISETHRFSDEKKASHFLSNHAIDFYTPFFFQMALESVLSKYQIPIDQLYGIFREIEEPFKGIDGRSTLAGAYTHGDLAPINMLIDERDRLHVIDWEHFGAGSVALDLVKLLKISPRGALAALSTITTGGHGCSLSATEQFKIALAVEVILNRRNFKDIFNFHVEHAGKKPSKAQFTISKAEKDALMLMSQLNDIRL